MIIDFRAYTLKPGKVQAFMELFEREGLEPQRRICGNFIGIFRTEIGNINEIIMMFGYENAGERERRRALLFQDPAFQAFVAKARDLMTEQTVRMLVPAPFNPPIGESPM
jgi:hypothetical protein